jgi:Flp pilus assembly protein TadD
MKSAEELYNDILPLMENNWREAAVSALGKLLEKYPDFAVAHNDLGVICADADDQGKALFHLRKSVDLEPENAVFQKSLADYYYIKLGETEEALRTYKKVLSLSPDDTDALILAGNISTSLSRFEDAGSFYNRILAIEPWHQEAANNLAQLDNIESGEPERQIGEPGINPGIIEKDPVDYGQTASLEKTSTREDLYNKSLHLAESGQDEEAAVQLRRLIKKDPGYAPAHNDLGVLLCKLGDKKNALKHYKEALALDSGNIIFQKNLADYYYFAEGKIEEALRLYFDLLKAKPDDTEVLMTAGLISTELDKIDNAVFFYSKVLEIEPWNIDADERLKALNNQGTEENKVAVQGLSGMAG